jgi:ankyrin repeat protein
VSDSTTVQSTLAASVPTDTSTAKVTSEISLSSRSGMLSEADADVDATDQKGKTPLHLAAKRGDKASILLLVKKRANVNAIDKEGNTPLLDLASCEARPFRSTVKFLVQSGAKVGMADNYGNTPLSKALSRGYFNISEFLLQNGAQVDSVNKQGDTPMHHAAAHRPKLVRLLLDHGAGRIINKKNYSWGNTPLHVAMIGESRGVIKLLLQNGADANPNTNRNNFGQSVQAVAKEFHRPENIKTLCTAKGWRCKITENVAILIQGKNEDGSEFVQQLKY